MCSVLGPEQPNSEHKANSGMLLLKIIRTGLALLASKEMLHCEANVFNGSEAEAASLRGKLTLGNAGYRPPEDIFEPRKVVVMRPWRGALALLTLNALTGCDVLSGGHSYRYRLTVEVETPDGLRTGSSIWEVETKAGSGIPDRSLRSRVHGEAVAVELPSGVLFATMRSQVLNSPGDYAAGLVNSHLRREPEPGAVMTRDWAENMRRIAQAKPSFELAPDERPLLVRFRNPKDANSVELRST